MLNLAYRTGHTTAALTLTSNYHLPEDRQCAWTWAFLVVVTAFGLRLVSCVEQQRRAIMTQPGTALSSSADQTQPAQSDHPRTTLNDSAPLDSSYEDALKLYADRFYPMFPVLKEKRLRADLQDGKLIQSSSFATLMESIMVLQESAHAIESAATPDAGEATVRPIGPKLAALAARSPCLDAINVDTIMVSFHLFVAFEMHGHKAASWFRLQEALTLAHMLGPPKTFGTETEEHIRLYWIMCVRGAAAGRAIPDLNLA